MIKCKQCGGICKDIGGGNFECEFCGSVFSEEAFKTATTTKTAKVSDNGADVFEKNVNGILEIFCQGAHSSWAGSGYLISRDGYAVTNAHVAADSDGSPCRKMSVKLCGYNISATVVALADDNAGQGNGIDLAIIKLGQVPREAVALTFADADAVRNGEPVFVIGNSLGQGICITSGIVSDKAREIDGRTFIMTDCAVNGGNSGGPIFNRDGLVIGTITLQGRTHNGADAEGMNYALPANTVKMFISKVRQ